MRGADVDLPIEATGAGRWLVFHEVMAVRLAATDLARAGNREALCRASVRLHLWHWSVFRFVFVRSYELVQCFVRCGFMQ